MCLLGREANPNPNHAHACCACAYAYMCLLGREVRLRRDDRLGAVISRVELHARRLDEARAPAELEVEIRDTERWENRVMTREDADGPETYIESVLVGADDLRGAYEDLLATKRQLVGV